MKKLVLALLLLVLTVVITVRPVAAPETQAATPELTADSALASVDTKKRWIELDSGAETGTKISIDLSSFEVITPEDVFEFIVMMEFAQPQTTENELIIATIASVQISCKQKVAATVRDLSINIEQKSVLPNMLAKEFGVQPLEKGSHFGNIATFICTRGGTIDPTLKSEPKAREKRQADRDA